MTTKDFAQHLRQDQRLVLLRILGELPSYRSNSSVLVGLMEKMGHTMTRDQVKVEAESAGGVVVVELPESTDTTGESS